MTSATSAPSSDDAAPEPLSTGRRLLWLPLVLLGLAWFLVVPLLGLQAWASTWHLYGDAPSPSELRTQEHGFMVASLVSLAIALVGFALAVLVRSTVAGFGFAVLLVPTLLLALLWLGSWQSQQPHPAPPARSHGACQEFSGGDTRCPGG